MSITYDRDLFSYYWKALREGVVFLNNGPAFVLLCENNGLGGAFLITDKTMLFKQNLSSKFPRTIPFKQKLLVKIQLLWHIYTHKGLNDRIRFKTMLSMTMSWASFS